MSTWHEEMEDAVNLRKKAIAGVTRWQSKRAAAEKKIEELSAQQSAAAPLPVDEPALHDLQPAFGATSPSTFSDPFNA